MHRWALQPLLLLAFVALATVVCGAAIPPLDAFAGDWQKMELKRDPPVITNAHGSVAADHNLLSFNSLVVPPLSQGHHSCTLRVNGQPLNAERSRWSAYQFERSASVAIAGQPGRVSFGSTVRMGFEDSSVLLQLRVEQAQWDPRAPLNVSIDFEAMIRFFDETVVWNW